jgi:class 3 adenylate cyclase
VINPALKRQYKNTEYSVSSVIGIDSSILHATRTGVRKDNDLVWVGPAANHAAKLSSLPDDYSINISEGVFDAINSSLKKRLSSAESIWYEDRASGFGGQPIYRTNMELLFCV